MNCTQGLIETCSQIKISSCFKLRISLCCTNRRSLSKAALGPKRLNLRSCKLTVSNDSGQISNRICLERSTSKKHVLNRLWIKYCAWSTKPTLTTAIIKSRGVSNKRDRHALDSHGNEEKDVFAPCRTPAHQETTSPGLLHVVQAQTQPKTIIVPPWSTADGNRNSETCQNHMATIFSNAKQQTVNDEQSKSIVQCVENVLGWWESQPPTPRKQKRHIKQNSSISIYSQTKRVRTPR